MLNVLLISQVHILAKQDEFHGPQDSLLKISLVRNLTINGNGALLQMRRDDYAQPPRGTCPSCANYSKAEWRCGIWCDSPVPNNVSSAAFMSFISDSILLIPFFIYNICSEPGVLLATEVVLCKSSRPTVPPQ